MPRQGTVTPKGMVFYLTDLFDPSHPARGQNKERIRPPSGDALFFIAFSEKPFCFSPPSTEENNKMRSSPPHLGARRAYPIFSASTRGWSLRAPAQTGNAAGHSVKGGSCVPFRPRRSPHPFAEAPNRTGRPLPPSYSRGARAPRPAHSQSPPRRVRWAAL